MSCYWNAMEPASVPVAFHSQVPGKFSWSSASVVMQHVAESPPDVGKVLLLECDGTRVSARGGEAADGGLLDCRAAKKLHQASVTDLAHLPSYEKPVVQGIQLLALWQLI